MDNLSLGTIVIALVVLLVVSGFFSLAETSMMALNRYRLKHLVEVGRTGARLTQELLGKTDRLLGVILLGNNLVNAASALIVGEITRRYFGESQYALLAAGLVVTFLILVFSEITPKVIGATYPERLALPAAFVLAPMLKLAYPAVWFVNLFVQGLLRLFGLSRGAGQPEQRLSLPELRTLVLEAGHVIPAKHQSMLLNLFELETITVDDVMSPRSQIEALDRRAPIADTRRQLATCYHTRLPVYDGQLDQVVGIVHVRAVLNLGSLDELTNERLTSVLREPYFIPKGTPLLTQLQQFQERQDRLGLVVDEYGELQGLVTIDDILEEIIGEFTTGAPTSSAGVHRQADGSVLVEGGAMLRELNRKLGTRFPLDGPKTLNGLILEHFQDIPDAGTSILLAGQPVEIVQTQEKVVRAVRIYSTTKENPASENNAKL